MFDNHTDSRSVPLRRADFLAAARDGDFDALVVTLARNVVLRGAGGVTLTVISAEVCGALEVPSPAVTW